MEKSLHISPALIFSEDTAKRIFDKPQKVISAEIIRQKIKEAKERLSSQFFMNKRRFYVKKE